MGVEGNYLKIMKAIYDKPMANITLNGEKLKAYPAKQERDKSAHSHHYYSTVLKVLAMAIRGNKRNPDWKKKKGIHIGKETLTVCR